MNANTNIVNNETSNISKLEGKMTLKLVEAKINEIVEAINDINTRIDEIANMPKRDRGPKSEHAMTEEHAKRLILGDLKEVSHKLAATKLGLSYGQVYSARNGYTFKRIYKEGEELKNKNTK